MLQKSREKDKKISQAFKMCVESTKIIFECLFEGDRAKSNGKEKLKKTSENVDNIDSATLVVFFSSCTQCTGLTAMTMSKTKSMLIKFHWLWHSQFMAVFIMSPTSFL